MESSHGLSPAEREAWSDDGFFVRPRVFVAEELEALREAAERAAGRAHRELDGGEHYRIDGNRYIELAGTTVQMEHAEGSRRLRVLEPFHHLDPHFDGLVDDARIVEPMRELVGSPEVALFTDKLNLKRPREGSGFRWHQDSPYWTHACQHVDQLPNVMLALDDASAENGCLRVVRGSHREGVLPGCEGDGVLGPLFTHPRYVRQEDQVSAAMPAGSLLFFSPHTVHGSEPNRSGQPRRAVVLTYQPAGHPMFKLPATRPAGAAVSVGD